MSAKVDNEALLDAILAIMTDAGTGLNVRVAAIEAEKAAAGKALATSVLPIPAAGYFRQTWDEKILNTSPAIFYGFEDVVPVSNGPAVAKTYTIFIEVFLSALDITNDSTDRIFRYSRALEEIFSEAFKPLAETSQMTVKALLPAAFKVEMGAGQDVKIGGVSLSLSMF